MLPFRVRTEFPEERGVLVGMRTILRQGWREVVLDDSSKDSRLYLERLTGAMKSGMSLRITYWGSDYTDMDWMDDAVCGLQNCTGDNAGDVVISDVAVADF